MITVFIGGSRRVNRMNADIAHRLDNIINKQLKVIIGDANGFDRVTQTYLADNKYGNVLIYCTNGKCRNNVGHWPLCAVEYAGHDRGLAFFTAKDDAMLRDGDFGLFAWDGISKGTLRNIKKMAQYQKPSAVFLSPAHKFVTIRNTHDALHLLRDTPSQTAATEDLFSDTWRAA